MTLARRAKTIFQLSESCDDANQTYRPGLQVCFSNFGVCRNHRSKHNLLGPAPEILTHYTWMEPEHVYFLISSQVMCTITYQCSGPLLSAPITRSLGIQRRKAEFKLYCQEHLIFLLDIIIALKL